MTVRKVCDVHGIRGRDQHETLNFNVLVKSLITSSKITLLEITYYGQSQFVK